MKRLAEYHELTKESLAAVMAASLAYGSEVPNVGPGNRRRLAAFLREAMAQARSAPGAWAALADIANNLHSPPPPPPTLAEAREAARQLAGPCAAVVHAYLNSLQEAGQ